MKLSDAIRTGSKMGPQCFGNMLEGYSSCAIGAAFWALYGVEASPVGVMYKNRWQSWWPKEWLEMVNATCGTPCPACKDEQLDLSHVITHLNDTHLWSREAIAEYVETKEMEYEAWKGDGRGPVSGENVTPAPAVPEETVVHELYPVESR